MLRDVSLAAVAKPEMPETPALPTAPVASHRARRLSALALLVAGVLACGVYTAFERSAVGGLGFPLDDTWIHLQFARNLASGHGLAYQGERLVSGSTAPLWTALLSMVYVLGLPAVPAVKMLGALAYLLAAGACFALVRELDLGNDLALLATVLFLFTDWMVWSALSGMEISLFVAMSLFGMVLHLRERRAPARLPVSLVVLGAAELVRPEGLLLLACALLDRCLVLRLGKPWLVRPPWRSLALGSALTLLVVLVPALLSLYTAGSPFPTTLAVKTDGVARLWPQLRDLFTVAGILFRPQPWMFLLAGGGAVALVQRLGTGRDRGLLLPLWVLGLPLAYATLAPQGRPMPAGNFGRYFFPLLAPLIVLGVLGLEPAWRRGRELLAGARSRLLAGTLVAVVLLVPSVRALWLGASRYALSVRNVEDSDVLMGRYLAERLPPDAVVGLQDIGAIAYLAPQPIVDLAGIVTPEILPALEGEGTLDHPSRLGGLFAFLREHGVEYLVLYPESYSGLETLEELEPALRVVHRLPVRQNITMAGSELVLLATPYGRGEGSR